MNFEEIVQKIVNVEAKAGLRSTIIIQDSDIHCFQDYHSSNNITSKMQTLRITAKNSFYPKEPKIKDLKSALLPNNITELAKKKDKQKKLKYW